MISDKEYQLKNLERIYYEASLSPVFKKNSKYQGDGIPRIAYSDVRNHNYTIRWDKSWDGGLYWDEDTEVIANYETIDALINDGWRLD